MPLKPFGERALVNLLARVDAASTQLIVNYQLPMLVRLVGFFGLP
jgi:hypothetical protein